MYLAIKWQSSDEAVLQSLTPRIMHWKEDVWLMDLRVCLPYWRLVAKQRGCTLIDLLRELLHETFFIAVLANEAWQAIMMLNYLNERGLVGFVDRHSHFGSNLYRDISWQAWWRTALEVGEFCEQLRVKRFNLSTLKQHIKQMRQAVENVGAACPWELQAVGAQAIRRRYGEFLTRLWDWTFPDARRRISDDEFPWVSYQIPKKIMLKRWLDEPLYEWDHLSASLKEDFDKLCVLDSFTERQKLVCLEWRLTLHDASTLLVPIRFRHPHCLHREVHSHGTALLQANYAFHAAMKERQRECLAESDMYAPPIVGWDLVIQEQLILPPRMADLFGESDSDEITLLRLENRLPVRLYHFDLRSDWSPEESYAVFDSDMDTKHDYSHYSLNAMAKRRPLFLYQRRVPLARMRASSSLWQFTERTMNKWWQGHGGSTANGLAQDYYRYVDEKKRSLWVSRGDQNQWYVHGIFA